MWLLSLGMFTGYSPSASSLANRLKEGVIKRFEIGDSRVELYLEKILFDFPTCIEFNVTREHMVNSLQPATSDVYEYYDPAKAGANAKSYAMETVYEEPPKVTTPAVSRAASSTKVAALLVAALLTASA
mmetsp:Transcript_58506/g.189545  ORF Transcript_58506/g.189545 Transcript_58506/m.189545 type:complete len:129 (+) Transcript_58506:4293-4679(+)